MLDEDAIGFVAVWGWSDGGGNGRGHVSRKRVVLGVDAGNAHLELIRISRIVNRLFLCDKIGRASCRERV